MFWPGKTIYLVDFIQQFSLISLIYVAGSDNPSNINPIIAKKMNFPSIMLLA